MAEPAEQELQLAVQDVGHGIALSWLVPRSARWKTRALWVDAEIRECKSFIAFDAAREEEQRRQLRLMKRSSSLLLFLCRSTFTL